MNDFYDQLSGTTKHMADLLSIGIAVGTLSNLLPAVAAILTIIWTGIRIYETKTIQRLLNKPTE